MPDQIRSLRRSLTLLSVFTLIAFAAACASAGGGGGEGGIPIRVSNNLVPSVTLSIMAATEGATPVRLGTLVGGGEQMFTYRPTIPGGTFRLIADRPGPGGTLVSESIPFALSDSTQVEWELSTNNVVVR